MNKYLLIFVICYFIGFFYMNEYRIYRRGLVDLVERFRGFMLENCGR